MANLFTIIILISLVAVIVFAIKAVKATKGDKKKQLKNAGLSFAVAVLSLAGVGLTAPEVENSNQPTANEIVGGPEKVESDNANINDELTVDMYKNRVSKVFKEMGSDTNLKILSVLDQGDNSTDMRLSDDVVISIFTNDNIVNQLTLHMSTDSFYEGNDDFNFAYLLLIGTADDTLSMGKRSLILRELGLYNKDVFKKKYSSNTKVGVITYVYEGNTKDGYTLTAKW